MAAVYCWAPPAGSDLLATTAANWLMGPGTPAAVHTQTPDWDDDLYFQGDVTQANCLIPDLPEPTNPYGLTFNSIHLLFGAALAPEPGPIGSPPPTPTPQTAYLGTVTLAGSFPIGTLQVDCGVINQADAATLGLSTPNAGTLTVTTALDWTGGTLNNTSVAGFIDLAPGSISTAEPSFENPGINGTVYLGSTITLRGEGVIQLGAQLTLNDGTYNMTNSQVSLHAMQFSLLAMTPGAPVPKPPKETDGEIKIKDNTTENPNPKAKVIIDPKAIASIVAVGGRQGIPRVTMTGEKPLVENNGKFTIDRAQKLEFAPDEGEDVAGGGLYQNHEDAITELTCGSTIICGAETSVDIRKGRLELKDAPGTTQRGDAQDPITITSPNPPRVGTTLSISAQSILTHTANDKGFIQLKVGGVFGCYGKLNLVASRLAEKSDTVEVTRSVSIGNKPLTIDWYSETGDTMAAGKGWTIITSTNTDMVADPITIEPTAPPVAQTNPGNFGITLETELNNAKDQFKVKIK